MLPPPGCDPESIVLSFPVAREFAGQRTDRFIQHRIPRLSRTRANEIVRACAFTAAGRKLRPSQRVKAGETVLLVRPRLTEPDCPREFDLLYEDEHVLALDKPPGLPMHPTATYHKNTLTYVLRERFGDESPRIAHRIDRETSGVVVCGKTREAERRLKRCFEQRRVAKTYLAIVRGRLASDSGVLEWPLGRPATGLHLLMETKPAGTGLFARSRFLVLARASHHTLVRMFPETGRQHQLRVHLARAGHPIVGDKLYGPEGSSAFIEYIDQGLTPSLLERLGHRRQALHAETLCFAHPMTAEPMNIQAPLPIDLKHLWSSVSGTVRPMHMPVEGATAC